MKSESQTDGGGRGLNKLGFAVLCLFAFLAAFTTAPAQDAATVPTSNSNFSSEQLDELVAPVALYPDPLLADVLTASTYPLEVVDADHWAGDPQNAALNGDDLTDALAARGWDPSVQSLVPFPEVLQLMDAHLDWMETLGEAFLAQAGDVMDAVQRMRARAQSEGNLPSNDEEAVADQDGVIAISPPSDLVYVPEYNPWCAFGGWPYPVASQSYFGSWSGNCDPVDYGVVFGAGIAWPFSYWGWGYFDWQHHHILIRPNMYRQFRPNSPLKGIVWQHDPRHRDGALYRNARNARTFGQPVARGLPPQARPNPVAGFARPAPAARNWNMGRTFRVPPRRPVVRGNFSWSSFRPPTRNVGNAHASRVPAQH